MDGVGLRQKDYHHRCVAGQTQDERRMLNVF